MSLDKKMTLLRAAYRAAVVATAMMVWFAFSGEEMEITRAFVARSHRTPPAEFGGMMYAATVLLVAAMGLYLFLSSRPYWWGKLLCVWMGLSWCGYAVINFALVGYRTSLLVVLAAGLTMLVAAIVHQIADPRFSGTYLRAA